jgi:hypothetical protein
MFQEFKRLKNKSLQPASYTEQEWVNIFYITNQVCEKKEAFSKCPSCRAERLNLLKGAWEGYVAEHGES